MKRFLFAFSLFITVVMPAQLFAATTVVSDTVAANLVNRLTQNATAVFVSPASFIAIGNANQIGLVNNTNFGSIQATPVPAALTPVIMGATGIILTNGHINGTGGAPAAAGDADVFAELGATTGTFDAASIQFNFTVTAGQTAITFDLVFASNETIAAANPDAAVVMVDGINYAKLNNGGLLSNQTAGILTATAGAVVSGFTNVSQVQTVTALLVGTGTHTIKIAIADNVDRLIDSAVIVANLRATISAQGGMGVGDIFPPIITLDPAVGAIVNVEATTALTAVNLGAPTVTDNVDIGLRATPVPAGPYAVGARIVTWSSTDAAGNIGTTTQTVTVNDTTPPVITPPIARTFSAASPTLNADITAHLATVTATDLVTVILPAAILNNAPLAGFPIGNTTVTFTTADAAGNAATPQTTIITVTSASITPPGLSTDLTTRLVQDPNIIVSAPSIIVSSLNQTGLVNSTDLGQLLAGPPAVSLPLPQQAIMLTTGNISGTGGNLNAPNAAINPDADIFNILQQHPSFATTGTFDASALEFTFTVPAGTTSVSFDLIYASNELIGGIQFPDAAVVMVDGTNRAVFGNGLLLSNLNGAFLTPTAGTLVPGFTNVSQVQTLTAAFVDPNITSHTIKISIADNNDGLVDSALIIGNMRIDTSTQNGMGVGDIFPPIITLNPPAAILDALPVGTKNVTIEANAPLSTTNLGAPTVTDNVDIGLRATAVPAAAYPVGATLITWTATDAAGNIGTATQTITVTDTTLPVVTAPLAKEFFTNNPTMATDITTYLATVTAIDIVGVVGAITNDAPLAGFPIGPTTVTFSATDAAGNIGTATAIITVTGASIANSIDPVTLANRLVQAPITYTAAQVLPVGLPIDQTGLVNSIDLGQLIVGPPAASLLLPQQGIMLTTGNTSGTRGNIRAPAAAAGGDIDVFNALSNNLSFQTTGTFDASTLQFTFTVPAGTPSISMELIYATNELIGGIQFPDAAVVMVDGTNRAVFGNGLLLSNLNGAFLTATAGTLVPGFTNVSQVQTLTVILTPTINNQHTIKITIADNNDALLDSALIVSNMKVATSTQAGMGVGDVFPPLVIAPANVTVEATGTLTSANLGAPIVTDNVDLAPRAIASIAGPYPLGNTIVTWTSTDVAGNVSIPVTTTVTIVDTTPPLLTAPVANSFAASSTAGLAASDPVLAAYLATVTASDAVGVQSISNNAPAVFPVGITTVTFTATDLFRQTSTATTNITITAFTAGGGGVAVPVANGLDQIPPVIKLVGSKQVKVLQTALAALYADPGATVIDNFDGVTPGVIPATTTIDTSIIGRTVLTYSATDLAGNTATIIRTVDVVAAITGVDVLPPVVTPPLDILVASTSFAGIAQNDPSLAAFFAVAPNPIAILTAVDNIGLAGAITNNAPDPIPVGKTIVTFSARDVQGNIGTADAVITVSGVAQNSGAATDSDLDAMPDAWEIAVFGNLITADIGTDFDADGLTDAIERILGTNPLLANTNASGASTDFKDAIYANSPSDSDGDGIIDALEDNSSVLDATVVTGIPAPGRATTFSIQGNGSAIQSVSVTQIASAPVNVINAYGMLSYHVLTTVGGTVTVQINSSQPFGTNAQFHKVDAAGNYTVIPAANVSMVGANTINLTLTDGGPFDLDGIANGVIVDPIAFGASPTVLGANGGVSGGGCTLQTGARFDPLLPSLFALSLLFMLTRRKQRTRY